MTEYVTPNLKIRDVIIKVVVVLVLFYVGDFIIFHVLKKGMDRYYGLNKPAKILCVGHSHTVLGIDARKLEKELGVSVAKYATAGANVVDRNWMIRQFITRQPSVRVVVYDVDARLFDSDGLSSASYTLFLPYLNDPAMSTYLHQEATWQEYYPAKVIRTLRFRDQSINIALRGVLGKEENKKYTKMRVADYQGFLAREKERGIHINPAAQSVFLETLQYLAGKGIQVVLVNIPVADLLNEIDPARQVEMVRFFRKLAEENEKITFLDYNKDYQHRHELFYDLRHLNMDGNGIVTARLGEDLRRVSRPE
jgi:hypothetical protein